MDDSKANTRRQLNLRDDTISGDSQGSHRSLQDGSDGPPEPQNEDSLADTNCVMPDIMEMRNHPDTVAVETRSTRRPPLGLSGCIWKFWKRQISVVVPPEAWRDHLGKARRDFYCENLLYQEHSPN